MLESVSHRIKKQFMRLALVFFAIAVVVPSITGCSKGKSDEEIIGDLAQKFMLAMYTSNKDLAKEICNDTGYKTFESLSSLMALGTMGMNKEIDEAVIISKINVVEVKMISEDKGVATVMTSLGQKPGQYAIPAVKDAEGNWKVSVTKQSFN